MTPSQSLPFLGAARNALVDELEAAVRRTERSACDPAGKRRLADPARWRDIERFRGRALVPEGAAVRTGLGAMRCGHFTRLSPVDRPQRRPVRRVVGIEVPQRFTSAHNARVLGGVVGTEVPQRFTGAHNAGAT